MDATPEGPSRGPLTPDEVAAVERRWLETVYRGDRMPEFTLQVFVVGVILAFLMVAFNIYMGLKTGWGEGGSVIAVILGFAMVRAVGRSYSPLENNIAQTFASAAGSLGNIMNVLPALALLHADGILERGLTMADILLWVFFSSFLGVFFAIPLRRQFLVADPLVFPTGTAAARAIEAMHDQGAEAMRKARALTLTGIAGALVTWLRDGPGAFLPGQVLLPGWLKGLGGVPFAKMTVGASFSPLMLGAGFLVGPRVGASLLLGAVLAWVLAAPLLHAWGVDVGIARSMVLPEDGPSCLALYGTPDLDEIGAAALAADCRPFAQLRGEAYYPVLVKWTMWPGLGLMIAAGLTATALQWRILLRAVTGLFRGGAGASPIAHLQIPFWQWALGFAAATAGVVGMLQVRFGVPWTYGLGAVALSFLLSVIAVRAAGETDINPMGQMGSITQIAFGVAQAGHGLPMAQVVGTNLLTGAVASSGASEAADMMHDLKAGWIVGSTPKKQVYAQLLGVAVGSVFCAFLFWALVQAHPIGSEMWPAPAAITWTGLATMMARGASAFPPYAGYGLAVGVALGILLPLAEAFGGERVRPWVPSAVGIGLALIVPFHFSFTICLGSMIALAIRSRDPAFLAAYGATMGAGAIAGEGIAGVAAACLGLLG